MYICDILNVVWEILYELESTSIVVVSERRLEYNVIQEYISSELYIMIYSITGWIVRTLRCKVSEVSELRILPFCFSPFDENVISLYYFSLRAPVDTI